MLTLSEVIFDLAFLLPPITVVLGAVTLAVTRRAPRAAPARPPDVAVT